MPIDIASLKTRLDSAVQAFRSTASADQVKSLDFMLNQSHVQAAQSLTGDRSGTPTNHILANVRSLLFNSSVLPDPSGGLALSTVSEEGDLVGRAPLEALDPGWVESVIAWLQNFGPAGKAPFVDTPAVIEIADNVNIAVVGDWGTGTSYRTDNQPAPAKKVADAMLQRNPHYTIHLGDVYYSGQPDEEQRNFLAVWPLGSKGSFTLNSNHEMYAGAKGYFGTTLKDPKFAAQNGCSYFALRNANWLVIGLDTAYHADELQLYQHGQLDPGQCAFLQTLLADAGSRKIILLTHHNGLSLDGATPTALWGQLVPALAQRDVWWYWGHLHAGVAYATKASTVRPRCCGHGAVPSGAPEMLKSNPAAVWYENTPVVDLLYPGRVHNGFVSLSLNGATLVESFVNEDGVAVH